MTEPRPVTLLIAAMGGEGGGVLTDWILAAAREERLVAQNTAIPGVAQRTGATTYYLEIFPERMPDGAPEPVMSIYPQVGDVDVMVATELVEAGRACQNGYVTPDRTTLIASTHRVYAMQEKTSMADGRLDTGRIETAVRQMAKQAILFDVDRAARDNGTVINAVILGAIAGAGVLPIPASTFERAIKAEGKAVDANLRGFTYGLKAAKGDIVELRPNPRAAARPAAAAPDVLASLRDRVVRDYPASAREIVMEGAARVFDYQDAAYATLYLDRLDRILAAERNARGDGAVVRETGRHLALWMAYEDVIRVAQIKTRGVRLEGVRRGAGAKGEQPVIVTEFLKPGVDELSSILPPSLGRRLIAWADRTGRRDTLNVGLHIRTSTVFGFLMLRAMAALKPWRRHGTRFGQEQALIERWLAAVEAAASRDASLAREIAECARLIKGYSDTHRRGVGNFLRLMDTLVDPALAAAGDKRADFTANAAAAIATARKAALADPEGAALDTALAQLATARA
ncbi:MAG TPA: indolepyruvate oxidoreductase subunit beta family protein [Alphaproteobacteria bacterium]|nr:indolepyruvate oxidoreductase subunit beta family protein [Alphaproteobacteria bacterium]